MNNVHISEVLTISRSTENMYDHILKEAKEIAHTEGLSQMNMRKVASKCNIALGTIYNYYPTKADIIFAIVEDFWKECFADFNKIYNPNLDFFKQLEVFYFHILNYLQQFESNWLEDLTNLSYVNKYKGKTKESQFMDNLINIFSELIKNHKSEFNEEIFDKFSENEIAKFILDNFIVMLKKFNKDYSLLDFVLKKLLS